MIISYRPFGALAQIHVFLHTLFIQNDTKTSVKKLEQCFEMNFEFIRRKRGDFAQNEKSSQKVTYASVVGNLSIAHTVTIYNNYYLSDSP